MRWGFFFLGLTFFIVATVASSIRTAEADSGSAISGIVYFDTNLDGKREPNERPAPGRVVDMTTSEGQPVDSAVSNGDGAYRLEGLVPGVQYWVSLQTDAETPCQTTFGFQYPPEEGQVVDSDIGVLAKGPGSISGAVFEDRNEDGVHDVGEVGSEGWDIQLVVRSDNGALYCHFQDLTDYSGRYSFTGLPLLAYEVRYWPESVLPFVVTFPLDRDYPSEGPHSPLVDLRDKPMASDVDIEVHFLGGASGITGLAFRDLNLNTLRDKNEPILNCVVYKDMIAAYRETPVGKVRVNNATISCPDAEWTLSGVAAGTYDIELFSWCVGPDAPLYPDQKGPSRSVTVSGGSQSSPVELNMCPQAQAWFPGPEPTPAPTVSPGVRINPPPLGIGPGGSDNALLPVALLATALVAGVAATVLALIGRRQARRSKP